MGIDKNRLEEGIRAARELARETDMLTEEIAQLERAFSELRFGVEASVTMGDGVNLAYEKNGDKWRFVVHGPVKTLLINASREVRVQAVRHFPGLLAAMSDATVLKTDRVRAARNWLGLLATAMKTAVAQLANKGTDE